MLKIRTQLNGLDLWIDEIEDTDKDFNLIWCGFVARIWLDSNNDILARSSWSAHDAFENLLEKIGETA
jgi:hypothetical protein